MSGWINFKELRSKLDFEKVLQHYGVEIKRKGEQHHGFCPLPTHQGKKNSPSFSANLERGIFQCFGCGAKGNVLEFAAIMEKVNVEDGQEFRALTIKLRDRFLPGQAGEKKEMKRTEPELQPEKEPPRSSPPSVLINEPLDFELKGLDLVHPYLPNRGFSKETIDHFGLGFCSRGLLKGRLAIPLHNGEGKLIGYAGRVVDDSAINEENPRYKFPAKREREGKTFEFHKTLFLYNGFRIKAHATGLVVVEGFTSVWWLHQNGIPGVVATMGADCSDRQAELIVSLVMPEGKVWIVPDGDEAGERYTQSLLGKISQHRFVRWIRLEAHKQPTDYPATFFRERIKL